MKRKIVGQLCACLILFIGFFTSTVQYFSGRSLWLDESLLALNIIHRTPGELLTPLSGNQVAPVLFLQLESLFLRVIPQPDLALRLFPLICFWCSMLLFYHILQLFFKSRSIILFGLAVFAFDATLIYYSSEIKQYICDIFVALLLYFILVKNYQTLNGRYFWLLTVGAVCIFLSNITPLLLLTTGVYLLYEHVYRSRLNIYYLVAAGVVWCTALMVYYYNFIDHHPTRAIMVAYWTNADAFMPFNGRILNWLGGRYTGMFFFAFHFGNVIGIVLSVLYGAGILALFVQQKYRQLILLLFPVLIHLLLSGLKMYPFEPRLYLYLSPLLILVCCHALAWLTPLFAKTLTLVLFLLMLRIVLIHPYPHIEHDDVKDCIMEIKHYRNGANKIYVTHLEGPSVHYYQDTRYFQSKDTIIYGCFSEGQMESAANKASLQQLKGRIWVISQHDQLHEDRFILHYLDSLGYHKLYGFTSAGGTNANLYGRQTGLRIL